MFLLTSLSTQELVLEKIYVCILTLLSSIDNMSILQNVRSSDFQFFSTLIIDCFNDLTVLLYHFLYVSRSIGLLHSCLKLPKVVLCQAYSKLNSLFIQKSCNNLLDSYKLWMDTLIPFVFFNSINIIWVFFLNRHLRFMFVVNFIFANLLET